jgi:DNA polymerase V
MKIPLFFSSVSAGFPSPADDFLDRPLDLNEYMVKHPSSTFFVRVKGSSMNGAGISSGDILVVDKSLKVKNDSIAVVYLNGEFTVKRIKIDNENISLVPQNPRYPVIKVSKEDDFMFWGAVTFVIKAIGR